MVSTGGTEGRFTEGKCGEYRGYRGQVQVHNVVSTGGTEGRFTVW